MNTKFFNNTPSNTLFDKFKGISEGMGENFKRFLAVVGYFRSSGYFKLRRELGNISEIRILVGINADSIFRKHNLGWEMLEAPERAKELFNDHFKQDIVDSNYSKEVEEGILQFCQDLADGRLQLRLHPTKNLHAKFYLCLPENHTEHSDGWVIMGSSNISDAGLGLTKAPRYELNVAMKDYDDVHFCHEEFETLWNESVPLTLDELKGPMEGTYLGDYQPSPYEIYIKVLIEAFGDQVEEDFNIQLPKGVMELKYQKDAVVQGYQMLLQHNGLFLSDVVGLGKTMIATMIAKRFIEANGKNTRILVVYPPALEDNWKSTFELFAITRKAQFITNGSLSKVLEGKGNYHDKENFDLIIVDEAHQFRTDTSNRYDELQKICKSPCTNPGLLKSYRKKVMLLSATPLNNRPEDLLNQLQLFQDTQRSTIDGITNLKQFFAPHIANYKKLMRERDRRDVSRDVDRIYEDIRDKVIDKVTIRRTRRNILNDPDYKVDLKRQGIVFPNILPPKELEYGLTLSLSKSFTNTLTALTDERAPEHITYARYRAVEFLKSPHREKYKNAVVIGQSLAGIYRVHMVKRLESSFFAFKKSLKTLLRITNDMIRMFEEDKVIIAPELNIKDMMFKGMDLDEITDYILNKGYSKNDFLYKAEDFDEKFIKMLHNDRDVLERLNAEWDGITDDPKLDRFTASIPEFVSTQINPTGKLVIFSESVDTVNYLYDFLTKKRGRTDVLKITAANRNSLFDTVKANFDANVPADKQQNRYSIIITSDVLAEGVNLHRSNVIINYDSPWNASRLMQRIGRVNRIGSVADNIYNYMFYPSPDGDKQIQLYKNALIKLQGFHSAFGEDAQIYSREEIVKDFNLFDSNVKDIVDKKIALLRELRHLYNTNREWYHRIKNLPLKSRVMRDTGKHSGSTVVFVSSKLKTEFYLVNGDRDPLAMDFLSAVGYLKAKPDEEAIPFNNADEHYSQVNRAVNLFNRDLQAQTDVDSIKNANLDKTAQTADKFLRTIEQNCEDEALKRDCGILRGYIKEGTYARLPRALKTISQEYKNDRAKIKAHARILAHRIGDLVEEYHHDSATDSSKVDAGTPSIIISETFI
ncbi:MAG: DEAD/DEAH box helicase family protein [Muribaculaceae bacterium]|nr:DEAD/DEAH box helicase family protein [Muribaculaceae bacterium]